MQLRAVTQMQAALHLKPALPAAQLEVLTMSMQLACTSQYASNEVHLLHASPAWLHGRQCFSRAHQMVHAHFAGIGIISTFRNHHAWCGCHHDPH